MGRQKRNQMRGTGKSPSAEYPAGDAREGNGVTRADGKHDPDPVTQRPTDIADPTARVIRTNS